MNYWLIDGDNQSPQLAAQAAALLGWPKHLIVAGLEQNVASWRNLPIPTEVLTEFLVAPKIPDSADVLLAMAVGSKREEIDSVAIFSRDALVAGTLGRLLVMQGAKVLAISANHHPGLPYPHLTLPVNDAARIENHAGCQDNQLVADKASGVLPDACGMAITPLLDTTNLTEVQANAILDSIFLEAKTTVVRKADFCNLLSSRGFDSDARAKLLSTAMNYKIEVNNTIHYVVRR